MNKKMAWALAALLALWARPAEAADSDAVSITVNINNALAVNIENANFASAVNRSLGDDFVLPEDLDIDNESHGASADETTGFTQTYSLSGEITSPAAWASVGLSADVNAGQNDLVLLAVFSSADAALPASTEFDTASTGDLVIATSKTASASAFYGTGVATGKSGLSVAPAAAHERSLYLRVRMPTTSTVTAASVTIRLVVNAQLG